MKTAALFLSICLLYLAPAGQACADSCAQTAQSMAASRGAQVIKVTKVNEGGRTVCVITLRVPSQGGQPPRVETVRVNG